MTYKRKGIDFCAYLGCLRQDYGGEIGELRYCNKHIQNEMTEEEYQSDLNYCSQIATEQGVEFGKVASS